MKFTAKMFLFNILILFVFKKPVKAGLFDFFKSDDESNEDDGEWGKIFDDGEKVCGYLGGSATKVEDKLDNCYDEYVKESRVRMSIGFELCFGFNFGRLNNTVSKPLKYMQRIVNTRVLDLSLEVCKAHDNIERRPKLDSGAVDIDTEQATVGRCKVFFDKVIDAIYAEDYSIDDVYKEHRQNLVELYRESEIEKIEKQIRDLVHPVDECKVPESTLKDNLIIKYTKKYLQAIVNPQMPSFNYENLDVIMHPEKYMLKNEQPDFPDFDEMIENEKEEELHVAEENGDVVHQEEIKDPTKRFVIMRGKPKHGGRIIMKPRAYGHLPAEVKQKILDSDELIKNIEDVIKKNPDMSETEKNILSDRRQEELDTWWNKNADEMYRRGDITKEEMEKSVFTSSSHEHVKGKKVLLKDAPEDQWKPFDDKTVYHNESNFLPRIYLFN